MSVYTSNGFKIYRSTDDGAAWGLAGDFPLAGNDIRELAAIGTEIFAGLGNYASVYRSVDAGATWQPAREGLTGLDIKTIFPSGPRIFSGSLSDEGVHVSNDGGATWQASGIGLPDPYRTVNAFTQNSGYLFAAVQYWGTYRSNNNGMSWVPATSGLTTTGSRQIRALTLNGETIYVATEDGVWKTTNNGDTWVVASPPGGMLRPDTLSIAALAGNLFAGTVNDGLFKSSDNGNIWTPANNGIATAGAIYSLTVRGTDLFAGTATGVYMSADNGASWSPRNNGLPSGAARTVAAQGTTLVTAIYDVDSLVSRGVFISENSGTSWSNFGGGLDPFAVRTLAFNGNAIYAGTEAHSILSSQLAGAPTPTSVVSRKTHGTAGTFDIHLPLTGTPGVECRRGGANGNHEVVFTFPSAVTLSGATITPQAGMSGSMSGVPVIQSRWTDGDIAPDKRYQWTDDRDDLVGRKQRYRRQQCQRPDEFPNR